jgi:5'-AMP-activated protein kinase regulatory beta subunit
MIHLSWGHKITKQEEKPMKKQVQKSPKRRRITFSFDAPKVANVSLVGEFNNWDPSKHPMKCNANGKWTKTVVLDPGIYEYKFVADENWVADPQNSHARLNCYGTFNSLITVSTPKP